ncbi:hypothetical protein ISN44_As12g021540 [Arabidopsis suecica]|uniref:Uncharacterized protein n=1 Tax=Arabidopsis suecica TaxID=45249 RepID=A0A8T1YKV5_ARASU|nr:hypothetical protein ISN44_As12g021540 [Arabidopsis suecica]
MPFRFFVELVMHSTILISSQTQGSIHSTYLDADAKYELQSYSLRVVLLLKPKPLSNFVKSSIPVASSLLWINYCLRRYHAS